jgi:hypothetical protein
MRETGDHDREISDHHRETGDHDAAQSVITMPRNQ